MSNKNRVTHGQQTEIQQKIVNTWSPYKLERLNTETVSEPLENLLQFFLLSFFFFFRFIIIDIYPVFMKDSYGHRGLKNGVSSLTSSPRYLDSHLRNLNLQFLIVPRVFR